MPTSRPPKRFRPSYDTESAEEYAAQVETCAPWEHMDSWAERMAAGAPSECKRVKHIMIRGGRKASRYKNAEFSGGVDLTPYVPDPVESSSRLTRGGGPSAESLGRPAPGELPKTRPGSRKGESEGKVTSDRLSGLHPIYSRRTQSVQIGSKSGLEEEIRRGLDRYRYRFDWGGSGLSVPSTVAALIGAGVPPRAARILVQRAALKWFDVTTLDEFLGKGKSFLSVVEDALGAELVLGFNDRGTGVDLRGKGLPIRYIGIKGQPAVVVQAMSFVGADEESEIEKPSVRLDIDPPMEFTLNAQGLEKAITEWVKFSKRDTDYYKAEAMDPRFLRDLFDVSIPREAAEYPDVTHLEIFLATPKDGNLRSTREPVRVTLTGEHSKIDQESDEDLHIKYRSLENVSLTDLPRVLAALSQRHKREGRRLPTIGSDVKSNPDTMPNNLSTPVISTAVPMMTLDYVFQKAYPTDGRPAELVQVPGKPDRVYWPVTKIRSRRVGPGESRRSRVPVSLKEVDVEQAKSWLGIAKVGRKFQPAMSQTAETVYEQQRQSEQATRRSTALTNPSTAGKTAKEPRMSDEQYWMDQFTPAPFGASASIPVVRRNGEYEEEEEFEIAMDNPDDEEEVEFETVLENPRGFPSILRRAAKLRASGHDRKSALKMAWAEARKRKGGKGRKARASAKPRAAARKPRATARKVTARKPVAKKRVVQHDVALLRKKVATRAQKIMAKVPGCDLGKAMKQAWREIAGTKTKRRASRAAANPWFHEDGSHLYLPDTTAVRPALVKAPYEWADKTEVRSALVGGRYGGKKAKANPFLSRSPETDMWDHHPIYEQTIGQFSTGEQFTMGFQPMNRRNPGGTMTAVFPGTCANCGRAIERGDEIADSGKRGPKGGKKMAHAACC